MRLHIAAVAAIFFIFGKASAQSSQGPQGTVSGHLYCADSQTPCRFASVIIQSAPPIRDGKPVASDAPSHSYSSATDIEGAYQISGVAPGEYYALEKLQGYLSAYDLAVSMYSGDSSLSAQALEIALWRQWKTTRRRRAALLQLGVRTRLATNTAGSGRGPLVPCPRQSPFCRAFQCILPLIRSSFVIRELLA